MSSFRDLVSLMGEGGSIIEGRGKRSSLKQATSSIADTSVLGLKRKALSVLSQTPEPAPKKGRTHSGDAKQNSTVGADKPKVKETKPKDSKTPTKKNGKTPSVTPKKAAKDAAAVDKPKKTPTKSDTEKMAGAKKPSEEDTVNKKDWIVTTRNVYLVSAPAKQHEDDVNVCQCGHNEGCGDDCINRLLHIECHPNFCPAGHNCTNQRFQKKLFRKTKLISCDKKGRGLAANEDIPAGTLIIEYTGEVISDETFIERLNEAKRDNRKHFYFLTLNSNEVIDASKRGSYARFINHSCDPNSKTEKWMVGNAVRIGIVSIRDLKKGEEITFDYHFERYQKDEDRQKCYCGTAKCRGFLGEEKPKENKDKKKRKAKKPKKEKLPPPVDNRTREEKKYDLIMKQIEQREKREARRYGKVSTNMLRFQREDVSVVMSVFDEVRNDSSVAPTKLSAPVFLMRNRRKADSALMKDIHRELKLAAERSNDGGSQTAEPTVAPVRPEVPLERRIARLEKIMQCLAGPHAGK